MKQELPPPPPTPTLAPTLAPAPAPAPAAAAEIEAQARPGLTFTEWLRQARRDIFSRPQIHNHAIRSPTTPARARNSLESE